MKAPKGHSLSLNVHLTLIALRGPAKGRRVATAALRDQAGPGCLQQQYFGSWMYLEDQMI